MFSSVSELHGQNMRSSTVEGLVNWPTIETALAKLYGCHVPEPIYVFFEDHDIQIVHPCWHPSISHISNHRSCKQEIFYVTHIKDLENLMMNYFAAMCVLFINGM